MPHKSHIPDTVLENVNLSPESGTSCQLRSILSLMVELVKILGYIFKSLLLSFRERDRHRERE